MANKTEELSGYVLRINNYKNTSIIARVLTKDYGLVPFLVHEARREGNKYHDVFVLGNFLNINAELPTRRGGLAFVRSASKGATPHLSTQASAYLQLTNQFIAYSNDRYSNDTQTNRNVYDTYTQALQAYEKGTNPRIVTIYVQLKLMGEYGVDIDWLHDVIDKKTILGEFDYSEIYNGIISRKFWDLDRHRLHISQKAMFFIRKLSLINIDDVTDIQLENETINEMEDVIDKIYEKQIGVHFYNQWALKQTR